MCILDGPGASHCASSAASSSASGGLPLTYVAAGAGGGVLILVLIIVIVLRRRRARRQGPAPGQEDEFAAVIGHLQVAPGRKGSTGEFMTKKSANVARSPSVVAGFSNPAFASQAFDRRHAENPIFEESPTHTPHQTPRSRSKSSHVMAGDELYAPQQTGPEGPTYEPAINLRTRQMSVTSNLSNYAPVEKIQANSKKSSKSPSQSSIAVAKPEPAYDIAARESIRQPTKANAGDMKFSTIESTQQPAVESKKTKKHKVVIGENGEKMIIKEKIVIGPDGQEIVIQKKKQVVIGEDGVAVVVKKKKDNSAVPKSVPVVAPESEYDTKTPAFAALTTDTMYDNSDVFDGSAATDGVMLVSPDEDPFIRPQYEVVNPSRTGTATSTDLPAYNHLNREEAQPAYNVLVRNGSAQGPGSYANIVGTESNADQTLPRRPYPAPHELLDVDRMGTQEIVLASLGLPLPDAKFDTLREDNAVVGSAEEPDFTFDVGPKQEFDDGGYLDF
jgi:hypothetical protein